MSDHIKNMEASAEQQRTGTDMEHLPPSSTPGTARPQPFTPDLIPDPVSCECERTFAHADQAEWMRGKAAHAVRERRLYRPRA
ncbi:hypothetical protein ACFV42_23465 [Streptomyces solisilvae]|uniref:hypothetical protein n=1 Tax=Streptomyces malaysiensis TaxID=92644 RepID=UPI00367847E4